MSEKEQLGILGSGKRWLINRLFGAEKRALGERFDRIESLVSTGEQRLQETIDLRTAEAQAVAAAQATALQRLADRQQGLEGRLGEAEQGLTLQMREVATGLAQLSEAEEGLAKRMEGFAHGLTERVGAVEQALAARMDGVEQAMGGRMGSLEDGLAGLEQVITQQFGAAQQAGLAARQHFEAQFTAVLQAQNAALDRLEAVGRKTDSAVDLIAAQTAQARRAHAQQFLWNQLARITDLQFTGPARNVLFLHNSYYHFYYLARALRRRGWRALSVSLEDPNGVNANYYHGEDVNLHDPDPLQRIANVEALYEFAKSHFDLMHFAGDGIMTFFPAHFGMPDAPDIIAWKKLGKRIAYTISGCNSATAQSSVRAWSRQPGGQGMCDNCPWEGRPEVCSDERNLAWGVQVNKYCDMVFSELQPSLDYLSSRHANVVRGPTTMVLDEELWRPDLPIPKPFQVPREPGEVLVYHAFGNYDARGSQGRNIKGTPAIVAAVDRLRAEGLPVRLMFFTNVPNETVRYYQAQADIVVDQLWAGSWGANGRESLMLGKPVVGFLNKFEHDPADVLEAIATAPIVNANVDTIYDVLRELVQDPARRVALGARSREYALAWHSAGTGAARYELAYDGMLARSIRTTLPAEAPTS